MGEDSCRNMGSEKKPSTTPPHQNSDGSRSAVMSTCSEESESTSFGTTDDDKDQELEYGPGIVNKLRTRFLSITMMQQNRGLHRSNMRRSCSLENLLEQDRSSQSKILAAKEKWMSGDKSKSESNLWGNLKRAKSMDTLLLNANDQISEFTERPVVQLQNGFIKENHEMVKSEVHTTNDTQEIKLVKRKEGALNRSTLTICDDELPKPDTVKIYKRMFEPAESKRGLSHSNVRRRPPVLRASAKSGTATSSKQLVQQVKVTNGSLGTPPTKVQGAPPVRPKISAKEPQVNGLDKKDHVKSCSKNGKIITGDSTIGKPIVTKVAKTSCREELIVSNGHDLNGKAEEIIPRPNVRAVKETLEANSKPRPCPLKPTQPNKKLQMNGIDENTVKNIEEIIIEVEITKEIERIPEMTQKETTPLDKEELTQDNCTVPNGEVDSLEEEYKPDANLDSKTVAPNDNHSSSAPNEDQFLQSEVNNACVASSSASSNSLWQQKPSSNGGSNSVVFDFRGKDVVSHLTVLPAPFGCKALRKRSLRIDGKEAVPYTNGLANGSAALHNGSQEDEEDEDVYEMDYSVPLPSGVVFEGENVVVGKGAILTIRNKSLKIQFDDEENNDTFVYPSETSLLEEPEPAPKAPCEVDPEGSTDEGNDENNFIHNGHAKLRSNTSLGNTGGLTTYTPSVLRTVNNFEPGMFRSTQIEEKVENEKTNSSNEAKDQNGDSTEEEMLKPADPELISSWSLSASTSDLLF